MSLKAVAFFVLSGLCVNAVGAKNQPLSKPLTDLQERLSQVNRSVDLRKDYGLIRLWSFDQEKNYFNEKLFSVLNPNLLLEVNRGVYPLQSSEEKTFVKFKRQGWIESDESLLIEPVMNELKAARAQLKEEQKSFFSRFFPEQEGPTSGLDSIREMTPVDAAILKKHSTLLQNSTSLMGPRYTVGGWFKPAEGNDRYQMLLKKYFTTSRASTLNDERVEWSLKISGNILYFEHHRDQFKVADLKYLPKETVEQFRFDHRLNPEDFSDALNGMRLPEIPRLQIPAPGQTTLDSFLTLNFSTFWHAQVLGRCYECEKQYTTSDVWNYIAISVVLDDPMGPYADFYILQDPTERGQWVSPDFKTHYYHKRIKLSEKLSSFDMITPFNYAKDIEKSCAAKTTCVKSVMQVGGEKQATAYEGYMRGVYISKKALNKEQVLDMAARYFPNDKVRFTYDKVLVPR